MGEHSLPIERLQGRALEKALLTKLTDLFGSSGITAEVHAARTEGADAVILARRGRDRFTLFLDVGGSGEPKRVLETIGRAHLKEPGGETAYWVFGAPYISQRTAELCQKGGVGYIDLAGNFHIDTGPILLSARSNEEIQQERKVQRTLFSPRASRISLALLLEPEKLWTQRALADETKVSLGLVNRAVHELTRQRFLAEEEDKWRLVDRDALLAAWAKDYAARPRTGERFLAQGALEDVEARLDRDAAEKKYRYALTREGAAKYRAPFAPAAQLVFYADAPGREIGRRLELKLVDYGWNVEILAPPDEGAFIQRRRVSPSGGSSEDGPGLGRYVTNDIYLYLDLWASPARGKEQAERLLEVIRDEPRRRKRTTEQEARFQEFLKLRERANAKMRDAKWEDAITDFERALAEIKDLKDEQAKDVRDVELIHYLLTVEHLLRERWEDRKRRGALLNKLQWWISDDEKLLDQFPPYRMNHALLRFLLGTKHAILAAASEGGDQDHHARVAVQHFKVAVSPYTEGANSVVGDVEKVREWLRKVAEIDLVL